MNAPIVRDRGLQSKRASSQARGQVLRMALMPAMHRRRLQCYLALMLADIAALVMSFGVTGYIDTAYRGMSAELIVVQLLLPIYLTVALYNGAYTKSALASTEYSVSRSLSALVVSSGLAVFATFLSKSTAEVSRLEFSLTLVAATVAIMVTRGQMRHFVRWRCGARVVNELVIDDEGPEVSLTGAYHVSARSFELSPMLDDPHALDRIGLVMRNADRVIVSSPPERRAQWAIILKGANVAGEVIDETVAQLSALGARNVRGQGLLQVSVGPLGMRSRLAKRMLDLSLAIVALVLLSPLLTIVAVAIKLEDRGPIFFVQRRVGRGNCFFSIYKFRSMRCSTVGLDGTRSASKADERITRIGRFIRATSIDELPQLVNVVMGDMSLVGPRPHAIGSQAGDKLFWEVDTRYWLRHALKPGLTGLAQVRGLRGATDCEEDLSGRLNADLEYLNGWSLWRDLWILLSTFAVVLHEKAF